MKAFSCSRKETCFIKGEQILSIEQKFLLAHLETKRVFMKFLGEFLCKDSAFFQFKIHCGTVAPGFVG